MYYPKYIVITTKLWSSHHFFASLSSSVRYRIETFIRQFSNFVNYRFLNEIVCITLIYKKSSCNRRNRSVHLPILMVVWNNFTTILAPIGNPFWKLLDYRPLGAHPNPFHKYTLHFLFKLYFYQRNFWIWQRTS